MSKKVLIVEDEFIEANNLELILEKAGYTVTGIARSVPAARESMQLQRPDFVLIDIFLNGPETGIDLAWELKAQHIPFLYLSANSNQQTLEAAKQTTPYGFLVKPYRQKDVVLMLEIAVYQHQHGRAALTKQEPARKPASIAAATAFQQIIGQSRVMKTLLEQVQLVGPSATSVLLLGESGTGKERIADLIHQCSPRSQGPLVKVNCATLPSTLIESILFGHEKGAFTGASEKRIGKFEQAHQGTLFLDEIGEMAPDMQVKLLRVLQERELERVGGSTTIRVDVRVIAATNRNLEKAISEQKFRIDLYYRLNVFPLVLPPLRQRPEDIPLLANHFRDVFCRKLGKPLKTISPTAMNSLVQYTWPGNIRELEHVMERTILLSKEDVISRFLLPGSKQHNTVIPSLKTMAENEKAHIIDVLKSCNGKVSGPGGAASILGLPVSTLNARMKKLGITYGRSFL